MVFELLKHDLKRSEVSQHVLTFVSDKQKGLLLVFRNVLPNVRYRFCVRYLHGNMKVVGFQRKTLKDLMWKVARATIVNSFTVAMRELKAMDNDVFWVVIRRTP